MLESDTVWADVDDVSRIPPALVERLRHYFDTYKLAPGRPQRVVLGETYGRDRAEAVVSAALADYLETFGDHD